MTKRQLFRRTIFSGKRIKPYKQIPTELTHEAPSDGKMKASMIKRGIVVGQYVTVDHPQKAWSCTTKSTGVIAQVTHHFFVLWQPNRNYHECFLFVDVMRNTVKVKEERKNT